MADIELVIKLPEEDYENCMKYDALTSSIYKAIQRGTPLPKGHGRLIDANDINKILRPIEEGDDERAVTFETAIRLIHGALNRMLTIIEADKEDK